MDHTAAMERALEEIEKLKQQLRSERVLAVLSSDYSSFGLWEYDIAEDTFCRIKKLNGTYLDEPEYIPHFRKTMSGQGKILAEDLSEFNQFCDALVRGNSEVSCELRMIGEAPGILKVRFEGKPVLNDDGEPYKIVGRTVALTAETGGADNPSRRDPLTGLCSTEMFRDILTKKRSGINRYNNGAFLSVGIDKFRDLEAEQGREYSDYVQKCTARIIEDALESERDSAVTRLRSGEFLIYASFENVNAPDKIAKHIIDKVSGFAFDKAAATVSIGIARIRNNRSLEDVYNKSALALGEARKSGGNCFMHYSVTMGQTAAADKYGSMSSGGASRVYELIIGAFCSDDDRSALMKDAFNVAGQIVGASNIYMYDLFDPEHQIYMIYDATGLPSEECPGLDVDFHTIDFPTVFANNNSVRIHSADDKIAGFSLKNGAVCAECRATGYNGDFTGFFAFVFNSSFELTDNDLRIISALHGALEKIVSTAESSKSKNKAKWLRSTMIADHRIEGFSIIPETFVTEVVGENAAEHYNMHPGDICYKKMYNRNEPCDNCPALKLDESEDTRASSAFYNEKENRWLDITASVSENDQGERRYVVSSTDITDCLGKIQMKDNLTGVMTFDSFTAEAMRLTAAPEDKDAFIAVVSFAEFRRINEKHGFEAANSLLIAVARIFESCLREGELICRNTASRFVIMFKEDDSDEMFVRLSAILGSIHKQIFDRFKVAVYFVAGVCCADEEINVMGALDRAVTAKNTVSDRTFYNRNHIVFYDGILREQLKERRRIEASMMTAMKNNEFKVFYQPKVSIKTGKIVGAEALARWIRPNGEAVSPGKFIPIFEQNGFITDLDFAIYRNAFEDISNWVAKGIKVPLVSLNVSRYHLSDENFVSKLDMLIKEIGIPHRYIELEITETLLTENLETLVDTVQMLKDKGFRISVDDFGSGYSSLNFITQMPFDTLKIDGAFFLKNQLTERNKKVISSIVTLAKSLNLETVSEGVETDDQVDFLKELGCDIIQGFFYYKPMPSDEFEKLMVEKS